MTNLNSIVYVSAASKLLSPLEIENLLMRARARNIEMDITGVLLYTDGNFMQYLEGPPDQLDIIYKIIREDSQHTGLIELTQNSITKRQFGNWPMAYQTKDKYNYNGMVNETHTIEKDLEHLDFNPSSANLLLHNFWSNASPDL